MRVLAALVLLAAAAACTTVGEDTPLFAPRDTPDSGGIDAWPLEATYGSLNANVWLPKCAYPCHSGGDFAAGGFDMLPDPYASMVNVPAVGASTTTCGSSGLDRIEPGMPDLSLTYLKIVAKADGTTPVCGEGMPQGANRDPLTPEEIEFIRQWIADGATR